MENPGESLEKLSCQTLSELAEKHFRSIKKVKRSDEDIDTKLGRRTIKEVMESGETCFMGSCIDVTLSFLLELKKQGFNMKDIYLGCEFLTWIKDKRPAIHVYIEDRSGDKIRTIDFVNSNRIAVYEGGYINPREGNETRHEALFSLSANNITENSSIYDVARLLGIEGAEQMLTAYFAKLKHDNTEENFKNFQKQSKRVIVHVDGKRSLNTEKTNVQEELLEEMDEDKKSD